MKLKGDLLNITLDNIFEMILSYGTEGTLIVYDDKSRKEIFFGKDGIRLLSVGKRKMLPIGELLIKRKLLTTDQLKKALEAKSNSNLKLGEIIWDMGFVDKDTIAQILRGQIEDEICDIFRWKDAKYKFVDGLPTSDTTLTAEDAPSAGMILNITELINTVKKQNREWEGIKNFFTDPKAVFKIAGAKNQAEPGKVDFNEEIIIPLVDGLRNVDAIVAESPLSMLETYKAIYGLFQKEMIIADEESIGKTGRQFLENKRLEEQLSGFQEQLKSDPENLTVRENIAQALEKLGRTITASEEYKRLGKLFSDKNQIDKAITSFKKSIELAPMDEENYVALFELLSKQNEAEEAIDIGKQLIDIYAYSKDINEVAHWIDVLSGMIATTKLDKRSLEMQAYLGSAYFQVSEYVKYAAAVNKASKWHSADKIKDLIKTYENEIERAPSYSGIRFRLNFLRKVRNEQKARMKKWLVFSGISLIVLIIAAILGWNESSIYKKFHTLKTEAEDLKIKAQYQVAIDKYKNLRESFSLFSKPKIDKEINDLESQIRKKTDLISSKVNEELSGVTEILDGAVKSELNVEYDSILTILKSLESQVIEMTNNLPKKIASLGGGEAIVRIHMKTYQYLLKRIQTEIESIRGYLDNAGSLYRKAMELDRAGKLEESAKVFNQLINVYPGANTTRSAKMPLKLESVPSDAEVIVNNISLGKTPVKIYLPPKELTAIFFVKRGYSPVSRKVKAIEQTSLSVILEKAAMWTFDVKYPVETTPLLFGDVLYITTKNGYLKALNVSDGAFKWMFRTDEPSSISSSPKIYNNQVLFGAADGFFYAVRSNLALKSYQVKTNNSIVSTSFISADGTILFGSLDRNLYALDGESNGTILWKYNANARIVNPGAIYNDVVFITTEGGEVHAVNLKDGQKLWALPLGGELTAPIIKGDVLYIGASNSMLYALNIMQSIKRTDLSPVILWSNKLPAGIKASITAVGNVILVPSQDGCLYAFDLVAQKINWKFETQGMLSGGAIASEDENAVYFGSEDTNLYAISLATGQKLWQFKSNNKIRSTPAMDGKAIYFGADDGILYAIEK